MLKNFLPVTTFGGHGLKRRIQNIAAFRKPKFWAILLSAALALAIGACTLTGAQSEDTGGPTSSSSLEESTGTLKGAVETKTAETVSPESAGFVSSAQEDTVSSDDQQETFFDLFHELDRTSMLNYAEAHPEVLSGGWENININEAGLSDDGTDIRTSQGDQVLAINASEGVLLIRMELENSRGVLAICKDASRLRLCAAGTLPDTGQTVGEICQANGGILSLTGSAFLDDGTSNGGQLSGLAICGGTEMGTPMGENGAKRLELRTDNKMYIVDSADPVDGDTRDACEFQPALIVDGENVCGLSGWGRTLNPRAVLGQSKYLEPMLLVMEGRLTDSPGCTLDAVAEKLMEYDCAQAMNLDGGTSAILYYDGEYITRCSNTALPGGRTMPTAWVYGKSA